MAAGTGTAAGAMLALADARNVIDAFQGYRPLSSEALLLAEPDLVLTTAQTLEGIGGADALRRALPGLPSATRIAAFDGLYLLGFGPRLAHALARPGAGAVPGGKDAPRPGQAMGGIGVALARPRLIAGQGRDGSRALPRCCSWPWPSRCWWAPSASRRGAC